VGSPVSHRISRVRRYSRSYSTPHLGSSPTGLSPSPVARSSGVRLIPASWCEAPAGSSLYRVQPQSGIDGSLYRPTGLGSSRFARRYYGNPLCSSGYVRCFSSPSSLPDCSGSPVSPGGVAPFGDRRITGCQPLPCAFRRVAASFIGLKRLGIHHVLIFGYRHPACSAQAVSTSWCAR
jgi:hypothetical protein